MRQLKRAVAAGVVMLAGVAGAAAEIPVITVGVVIDGRSERSDALFELLEQEIAALTRNEFDLRIPDDVKFAGDWTRSTIESNLDRLLRDPEVDLVLALGAIAADVTARRGHLPKPVIAPLAIDAEVQGFPIDKVSGGSGRTNFTYVSIQAPTVRDIRAFRKIHAFRRLAVIVQPALVEAMPQLPESVLAGISALGVDVTPVAAGPTPEETVAAIPRDAEAVYVLPLLRFTWNDIERLALELESRSLPSFSMFGRREVELGLMASVRGRTFWARLARRTALDLQRVILGEDPATIPVEFPEYPRLVINMRTARAVGVYPTWQVMTDAELLHEEEDEDAPVLRLSEAVELAIGRNLELAALARGVAAGSYDVVEARAQLRPQVGATASGVLIDDDRASASFGAQSERTSTVGLALEQLVFVEPAVANLTIRSRLQEALELELETLRLDVIREAAVAYLDVLRARALLEVETDNLRVTRSNLDLAQIRQSVGTAGASEVYRWQSALASNRRAETVAKERLHIARVNLNRVLSRPQDTPFQTEAVDLGSRSLLTSDPRFFRFVYNQRSYDVFIDFMVEDGLARSLELARLDAAIAAARRRHDSARRQLYVPRFTLRAEVTKTVDEGGAGSEPLTLGIPIDLPQADDTNWSVALLGSLPLSSGGADAAARNRTLEELHQLEAERRAVANRVEQRIRTAMHQANASYYSIELTRAAAEAADKSLDLVTEAYAAGVVSITELLDAQNASLTANQAASNAVHDFLIDLMEVERATSRIGFFQTAEERDQLFDRIEELFIERGVPPLPADLAAPPTGAVGSD